MIIHHNGNTGITNKNIENPETKKAQWKSAITVFVIVACTSQHVTCRGHILLYTAWINRETILQLVSCKVSLESYSNGCYINGIDSAGVATVLY